MYGGLINSYKEKCCTNMLIWLVSIEFSSLSLESSSTIHIIIVCDIYNYLFIMLHVLLYYIPYDYTTSKHKMLLI